MVSCGLHLLVNATSVPNGKMLRTNKHTHTYTYINKVCYEKLLPIINEGVLVKRILELVTRTPDAHQTKCHQEAKKTANKRDGQQLQEETKQHCQHPSLRTGPQTGNRAGGSTKMEQRYMSGAVTQTHTLTLSFTPLKGWSDTELLEVFRHATVAMFRRYLDMGTASSTTTQTGIVQECTTCNMPSSQRRLQGFLKGDDGYENCPSIKDIQKAFPLLQFQKRHLPLVIKRVKTMCESALWALPSLWAHIHNWAIDQCLHLLRVMDTFVLKVRGGSTTITDH